MKRRMFFDKHNILEDCVPTGLDPWLHVSIKWQTQMWLRSVVVRALDLQSTGCGFDSWPSHY